MLITDHWLLRGFPHGSKDDRAHLEQLPRTRTQLLRLRAIQEVLRVAALRRGELVREQPRLPVELRGDHPTGRRPLPGLPTLVEAPHHLAPDGSREAPTRDAGRDGLRPVEAEPHAGHEV